MDGGTKKVIIIGGGFGGINVARKLGGKPGISVTIIDKKNHHLFQPLLYQVASAALNPADIAVPIRTIMSRYSNIDVLMSRVQSVDPEARTITTDFGEMSYDILVLACGAEHSYFGNDHWEVHAPGLKSLEEATEIRRRILESYERAEIHTDPEIQKQYLTFVVVGGGPTGVEMAGALGEISRFTLSREFRRIDPKRARVILIEGGPRILPSFDVKMSERASRDLENMGVTIWTNSKVTDIHHDGLTIGKEQIRSNTILWAAGIGPAPINKSLGVELDRQGRIPVNEYLQIPEYPDIFVVGDQAHFKGKDGQPLPGIAPVAIQQGIHVARSILNRAKGKEELPFKYVDKGIMATIGRERAVVQSGGFHFHGFFAWVMWLVVHIMYLIGFRNRFLVFAQWFWSYMTLRRGTRLITAKSWRTRQEKLLMARVADARGKQISARKDLAGAEKRAAEGTTAVKKKSARKTAKKAAKKAKTKKTK